MNPFPVLKLDHLGIRVTNLQLALDFYTLFYFEIDPSENLDEHQACVLIHNSGLRIKLLYNAANYQGHNVLIDAVIKYPGITHLAMQVDNMQETQKRLAKNGITITVLKCGLKWVI